MLRFTAHPCTSCSCVRCRGTNASGSGRSFASSRSAWNTSPRRSKRSGHTVTLADLRFSRSLEHQLRSRASGSRRHRRDARARNRRRHGAGAHAFDSSRPACPSSSAATPRRPIPHPFLHDPVDAVILDDGERAVPRMADAIDAGRPLREVPGLTVRERSGETVTTPADPATLRARRGAAAGAASRGAVAASVRLSRASAGVADRDRARMSVPLLVLLDLAAARAVGAGAIDRLGLPRLRGVWGPRLRRRRSVLASPAAQPRARAGAAPPRHPQAVDSRAEPRRSRRAATRSCSRRGARSRRTSTSSSASRPRPTRG